MTDKLKKKPKTELQQARELGQLEIIGSFLTAGAGVFVFGTGVVLSRYLKGNIDGNDLMLFGGGGALCSGMVGMTAQAIGKQVKDLKGKLGDLLAEEKSGIALAKERATSEVAELGSKLIQSGPDVSFKGP